MLYYYYAWHTLGEVIWLKDGVNISTGDIYTKDPVMAEDRGMYTARIDQLAGTVTLDYELRVQCK